MVWSTTLRENSVQKKRSEVRSHACIRLDFAPRLRGVYLRFAPVRTGVSSRYTLAVECSNTTNKLLPGKYRYSTRNLTPQSLKASKQRKDPRSG